MLQYREQSRQPEHGLIAPTIDQIRLAQIPYYDNPNVDMVGIYEPGVTGVALGLGEGHGDTPDAMLLWTRAHGTVGSLVEAAARRAQVGQPTIDQNVLRSAAFALAGSMQYWQQTVGNERAVPASPDFEDAVQVLRSRFDRDMNPRSPQASSFTPTSGPSGQRSRARATPGEDHAMPPVGAEVSREFEGVIDRVSAFVWSGKAVGGTRIRFCGGKLPAVSVDSHTDNARVALFSPPAAEEVRRRSSLARYQTGPLSTLTSMLTLEQDSSQINKAIPVNYRHFFTYHVPDGQLVHGEDRKAYATFIFRDSSTVTDNLGGSGRSHKEQHFIVEVPCRDAEALDRRFRQTPDSFLQFVDTAFPGARLPDTAPLGSAGVTSDDSDGLIVMGYNSLEPMLEEALDEDGSVRSGVMRLAPYYDGRFREIWQTAARQYKYRLVA